MPFVLNKYQAIKNKKIQLFMMQDLKLKPKTTQRLLSRKRVFKLDHTAYEISEEIKEEYVVLAEFEGHTRGLKPLLTFNDFALFDKPSNLMIHPNSKNTKYSLLDEIRYHFGKNANQIHRIDAETSGLLLVGLHEKSINELGEMFENKAYKKSYLAIVEGKVKKELDIKLKIEKEGQNIGVRMKAANKGKESQTIIKPLKYNQELNQTLVEAIPITGRQHQIRVHLYAMGHRIIGDPIYGVEDEYAEAYLNKTLDDETRLKVSKAKRLWLHANYLEFKYKERTYKIYSKNQDILNQI